MPAPVNVWTPTTVSSIADGGTAETVVLTSGPIQTDSIQNRVTGVGLLVSTPGTSGVTLTVKVRRNSVSGTTVYTSGALTVVATHPISVPFSFVDVPGDSHGLIYVVTVAIGSASGNGTVTAAILALITSE